MLCGCLVLVRCWAAPWQPPSSCQQHPLSQLGHPRMSLDFARCLLGANYPTENHAIRLLLKWGEFGGLCGVSNVLIYKQLLQRREQAWTNQSAVSASWACLGVMARLPQGPILYFYETLVIVPWGGNGLLAIFRWVGLSF